jgi:hypothetical protein
MSTQMDRSLPLQFEARFGARSVRIAAVVAVGTALAVAPTRASADPSAADKETARSLVKEGDRRFEARDYAAAVEAYRGAHAIMDVPTTGIGLGRAQEALGQLVEARDTFLEVARLPRRPREPAVFARVRSEAEQLADALAERIPSIQAEVSGAPATVERTVRLDDVALAPEVVTLPWKVNPGPHTVTVTAPGYRETTERVVVTEGQHTTVRLALVALPVATSATSAEPPPASVTADPVDARRPPRRAGTYLTYGGFGLGVVGVAVGSVTGLMHLTQTGDLRARCPGDVCAQSDASAIDSTKSLGTIANVAFAAGALGIGAGVVGLVLSRSGREPAAGDGGPRAGVRVMPVVGDRSVGVVGTF